MNRDLSEAERAGLLESIRIGGEKTLPEILRLEVCSLRDMAWLARKTGMNRTALFRSLSKNGNPKLDTLDAVLNSLGLRIKIGENHKHKPQQGEHSMAKNQLTHAKFYKVCDYVKTHAESLARSPNGVSATNAVSRGVGFLVSDKSVRAACEATGVPYPAQERLQRAGADNGLRMKKLRVLTTEAVIELAAHLGENGPAVQAMRSYYLQMRDDTTQS